MTLIEFIEKIKVENNIAYKTEDIEKQIMDKAKKKLNNKNGAIDNETIKKWIVSYKPRNESEADEETKHQEEAPEQSRVKIVGTKDKDKVEGSWGIQESLF